MRRIEEESYKKRSVETKIVLRHAASCDDSSEDVMSFILVVPNKTSRAMNRKVSG